MDEATYRINQSQIQSDAKCKCGHPYSAHGSNGYICAACRCKEFKSAEDVKAKV